MYGTMYILQTAVGLDYYNRHIICIEVTVLSFELELEPDEVEKANVS
jgi:hypothetical protein